MLHFCPQCNQHYDCEPRFQEIFDRSLPLPHSLQCRTPFESRCPECARKMVLLTGEKSTVPIPFAYKPQAAL